MIAFKKLLDIDTSKAKLWNIISDLGRIDKFHPGVQKSYYTNSLEQGFGAARICELQPSGKILETVKEWNDGSGFVLQIEPIEKAPPVKNFEGNFELEEINLQKTRVSITINYDMKFGSIGILLNKLIIQSKIEEGIDSLLTGLKLHAEMGIDIKDKEHLKEVYLKYSNINN